MSIAKSRAGGGGRGRRCKPERTCLGACSLSERAKQASSGDNKQHGAYRGKSGEGQPHHKGIACARQQRGELRHAPTVRGEASNTGQCRWHHLKRKEAAA